MIAKITCVFLMIISALARADEPAAIRSVAFSPDGKLLAAAVGDPKQPGAVMLYEVATRNLLWKHNEKNGIPAVVFSPDGRTLAAGGYGGDALLLDVPAGAVKQTLHHPKEVRGVAFSPDGQRLATACWDKSLRIWDLATMTVKITCTGHRDRIFSVAFSADGKRLLSAAGSDGVNLWDATTGKGIRYWRHGSFYVCCARFASDEPWVLTGGYDGTVRLWNAETGAERARFSGTGGVNELAFCQAARTLAVCGYGRSCGLFELNLRDPEAKELERIRHLLAKLDDDSYEVREGVCRDLLDIGFAAEAELRKAMKEARSAEVRIRCRHVRQELLSKPRVQLRGHTNEVLGLAFSPDGKLLASAGKDGTIRLWDMSSKQELARLAPAL